MYCKNCGSDIGKKFICNICGYNNQTLRRNKLTAVLLCVFAGMLGLHDFYMGRNGCGITKLVCTIFLIGAIINPVWCFIDLFTIVTDKSGRFVD